MLICASCQGENRDTAKFCRGCGKAVCTEEKPQAVPVGAGVNESKASGGAVSACEAPPVNLTITHVSAISDDSRRSQEGKPHENVKRDVEGSSARPAQDESSRRRPTCPSCGSSVRALDKFCIWCGQKQPERMPMETKRCPDCGTTLPVAANFCFACGHDVEAYKSKKISFPRELFEEADPELLPKFEA